MKKHLLFLALSFTLGMAHAQKGEMFPVIKGSTLESKSIQVPAGNGKYSVIAIAFNRHAEDDLKKWLNPMYDAFIPTGQENKKGIDIADVYDVNFVFIPMIAGFKRISEEFKKDTDKRFWQYVMDTEKSDISAVQDKLKISDNKIPYFFVLDASGKVLDVQSGKFSQAKLDKMTEVIE